MVIPVLLDKLLELLGEQRSLLQGRLLVFARLTFPPPNDGLALLGQIRQGVVADAASEHAARALIPAYWSWRCRWLAWAVHLGHLRNDGEGGLSDRLPTNTYLPHFASDFAETQYLKMSVLK